MDVQHLNKGRIDMILNCPWKYWRSYCYDGDEKAISTVDYSAAFLGNYAHEALEDFYSNGMVKKADLLKLFDEKNEQSPLRVDDYTAGRQMLDDWYDKVFTIYHEEIKSGKRKTLGVEVQFGYSPRNDTGEEMTIAGVPLHGYIDRVDEFVDDNGKRTLEVVDYKSNRQPKPRVEIDDDYNAEVNIYLIAARKLYPDYDEYVFVYDFLRWGLFKTSREKETLLDYARYMKRVYAYAEQLNDPPQKVGSACAWCNYQGECDALQEAIENGTIANKEQGDEATVMGSVARKHAEISALASAMYRRKAELESQMKTFLQDNDMMSFTDDTVQINLRARKSDSYDLNVVFEELLESHPELLKSVVSVTKGKLDKQMKNLPLEIRDKLLRTMKRGYQNPSLQINIREEV